MPRLLWISASLLLSGLASCAGDDDSAQPVTDACGEDGIVTCRCPDGTTGRAVCDDAGVVGICQCKRDSTPRAGSGPRSGTGGGGSGGSGGFGVLPGAGAGAGGSGTSLDDCSTSMLSLQVIDADYSGALDRIVVLASAPNEVVLVDPATLDSTSVELPLGGSSISVGPDGLTAAVAHNGYVSIVDLEAGSLSKTIATTTVAGDIVLAGNGFAYLLPESDQWVDIHSIEIATDTDHGSDNTWSIYARTLAKLHPSGQAIYGITVGLSPTDIERYDITGGVVSSVTDSQYHGDYPMCGDLFMSADGARLFTGCGTAFRAAPGTTEDMTYNGALEAPEMSAFASRYRAIAHDPVNDKVYAIPGMSSTFGGDMPQDAETRLDTFSYEFLSFDGSQRIPCMAANSNPVTMYGRFVFAAADGASIYVLARAQGAGLLHEWGLAVLPVE